MRFHLMWLCILAFGALPSRAADRYVSTNGTDSGDFTSWVTAANSIQLAVDAATNVDDTVWVSNGTYLLTTQITVTNKIKLQSANGYSSTLICADWPTYTTRCFYVANRGVVDGFTITNGHWDGSSGGGAYVTRTGAMQNCYFVNNVASNWGGGAYVEYGGMVSNCTFITNTVWGPGGKGGGVYLVYGGKALNCTIVSNRTISTTGLGGGAYVSSSTQTNTISGGVIAGNWGGYGGGGVYLLAAGELRGVLISNNYNSTYGGGGGVFVNGALTLITNCTIVDNTSQGVGGGGISLNNGGTVIDCVIARNKSNSGGSGRHGGGGIWLTGGSIVDRCTISNNTCSGSANGGGGGVVIANDRGTLRNSLVCGNTNSSGSGYGGGVALTNSLTANPPMVINCTIVNNYAKNEGGGIATLAITNYVANCIIAGNRSTGNLYPDVYNTGENSNNYWYCCANLPSAPLPPSQGNIAVDPLFLDSGAGNWRLSSRSPCINAGTNSAWMTAGVDLDAKPRLSPQPDGPVDIGAYEFAVQSGTIFTVR